MTAGPESKAWFERALEVLPGGVDSPVRAFGAVGGEPLVIASAHGSTITDVDGNDYVDFVGSWGPLILGHAHSKVIEAVETTARRGTSYGAPCRPEIALAEKVVSLYPGVEQVRFVSSGTEAVMSALRLARGATGRKLIVKFEGCYHGHVDHMLVAAGSGLVTLGQPSSAGVPEAFTELTRVLPLDSETALDELFANEGEEIAAVIIEPVPANNGLLIQRPEYLSHLRSLCDRHGTLLIFDEVISGFRLGPGGAAEHYGIRPDLATFGKVIGGGMPVGAFGGSRELMAELAPLGGVYQAGTLSGNPVAMAAGLATLETLEHEDGWSRLDELGSHLEHQLDAVIEDTNAAAAVARIGSIFWLALKTRDLPRTAAAIDPGAAEVYGGIFRALLADGVAIAPSAYEVGFISLVHSITDLDRLCAALQAALDQ
ncbi:MAG: glutamate-1-semialdehyde 2,1-aminomutase [Gammaproteobacteria bacterium]